MIIFASLNVNHDIRDVVGFIPTFLDEDDPRPAREQFKTNYVGGWNPFDGFEYDRETHSLKYPDDPLLRPLAVGVFRDEVIYVYRFAWVLIEQLDGSFEIARMD